MATGKGKTLRVRLASAAAVCLTVGTAATALPAGEELRVSESSYFSEAGREQASPDRVTTDSVDPQTARGKRSAASRAAAAGQSTQRILRDANTDFWFYAADVVLFADDDGDGYYYGIDLAFDADTYYEYADVYAVVYLSFEGGPWTAYAETDTFAINGASGDDEYVIVTELLAGYPRGSYDMLIELFDAWDDAFVADIGPADSSGLANLPLEDAERDAPVSVTRTVVVSQGGGGAAGWPFVAGVGLLVLGLQVLRHRRRLPSAATVRCARRGPFA